jgi:hypothetical protein
MMLHMGGACKRLINMPDKRLNIFFAYVCLGRLKTCPFSKICWDTINIGWESNQNFETMMVTAKQRSSHQFFMDLFLIGAWNIWKQRNGLIFNKMLPSIARGKGAFVMISFFKLIDSP